MKPENVNREKPPLIRSRATSSRVTSSRITSSRSTRRRPGRSHWAAIAFLFTFTLLLIAVCYYFLFPALEAAKHATPAERAKLRAYASLLLAIILIVLICGMLLTVR